MRTVDPQSWCKNLQKPPLSLSRPMRFGRRENKQECRMRRSFQDALKEYWRNCSVVGVKYIHDRRKPPCVRYVYGGLLVALLYTGVSAVVFQTYAWCSSEPATVALWDGLTILDVPFPAVGLCSNNVVSKQALLNYTNTLIGEKRYNLYSASAIQQHLSQLAHLLAMSLPEEDVDTAFMGYLASADPGLTVSGLMLQLAPRCSSLVVRCRWRGVSRPCEELFHTRVTPLGFCCVFNSRYQKQDIYKLPRYLDVAGEDKGLTVVVKQDLDDFAAFRRASQDIDVLIFDGSDYPLLEGGGARMYPVPWNSSTYLSLTTDAHYPEDGIYEDIESLRCRSRHMAGPPEGRSHAWCLAECRRRSLEALCSCRLHTLPSAADRDRNHDQVEECSLMHLKCLNKHREKFLYYYPQGRQPTDQETQNTQDCTHCAPDCARVRYAAAVAVVVRPADTDRPRGLPRENTATISLYYSSKDVKSYIFKSNSKWYENFVQSGSQWSLLVGASVVSVAELVFHCTLRWRHHYRRGAGAYNSCLWKQGEQNTNDAT